MKKLLTVALLAVVLVAGFSGCGKELDDENFVEYWVKTYSGEGGQELADEYGWSREELVAYLEGLVGDAERAEKVVAAVAERDERASFELGRLFFPLDDDRFVKVWLGTFDSRDDEEAYAAALKGYYLTPDDIEDYLAGLTFDKAREQDIYERLGGLFTDAGMRFGVEMLAYHIAQLRMFTE